MVYRVRGVDRPVLRGVSFSIERGRSYGLVGESGCGKSTAAIAIVRYLPRNGRISGGRVTVAGQEVLGFSSRQLREYHARTVSMVYQNPGSALNPGMKVGAQVAEAFTILGVGRREAEDRARAALERVQIADPGSGLGRYPHQLSGGMQQRVVIAMALAKNPSLLILDEPTTGLDATVEAEVLDLVVRLQAEFHTSVLFISHNLGVIAKMCSRVGVLYAGRLVEEGPVESILQDPRHPYTVALLRCIPRGGVRKDHGRLDTIAGFLPALGAEIAGCVFADRCAHADERCRTEEPPLILAGEGHESRCWYHDRASLLPREEARDLNPPARRAQDLAAVAPQAGRRFRGGGGAAACRPREPRARDRTYVDPEADAALRRPEAAGGDRACLRGRPSVGGLRRADLGTRRLRAGGDPQSARRAAGPEGRCLHLHLPRSRSRPLHLRPHR